MGITLKSNIFYEIVLGIGMGVATYHLPLVIAIMYITLSLIFPIALRLYNRRKYDVPMVLVLIGTVINIISIITLYCNPIQGFILLVYSILFAKHIMRC